MSICCVFCIQSIELMRMNLLCCCSQRTTNECIECKSQWATSWFVRQKMKNIRSEFDFERITKIIRWYYENEKKKLK